MALIAMSPKALVYFGSWVRIINEAAQYYTGTFISHIPGEQRSMCEDVK